MEIKKYKSAEERDLLAALITHDGVLGAVALTFKSLKDPAPFPNRWSNLIASWCFDYFAKYQKAPGRGIQQLFRKWAEQSPDSATADLVEQYLGTLSDQYAAAPELNEQHVIDTASNYFERIRLRRVAETIEDALERGDIKEANLAAQTPSICFSAESWKDPWLREAIKKAFRRKGEDQTVIEFPGDMGRFLSPYFQRTDFVSFCGPDKRGKSFWLLECVFAALKQRRRVLYYVLGDMSEEQVAQRLYCRLLRRPWKDAKLKIPVSMTPNGNKPNVRYRMEQRKGLTEQEVVEAVEKFKEKIAVREMRLRTRVDGGMVISASDIERDVTQFAMREGWAPDLVVVDYADLLAVEPSTARQEVRHQMNASWMVLRRIALTFSCLVLTATQTDSTAYNAWLIRKKNFSEDKRKNAHVTGMIGINQTEASDNGEPSEKELGVYRLNWVVLRGGGWSESRFLWTAGNLALACPCIISSRQ